MAGENPFYDLGNWYGANQEWWDTPFVRQDLSTRPGMDQGVWERFLTDWDYGGQSRKDMFGRSMFGRADAGYKAALMDNVNLNKIDYFKGLGGQLDKAWAGMAPSQRGEFQPSQTRWVRW